mmetsp:Transcript_38000/g.107336  ORF Transcript_38000/g.107336 Transcript_38000/m.107336 type:complete len:631 (-) Transcript_38000:186-2078(-)
MVVDVVAVIPFEVFLQLPDVSNIQLVKGLRFARLTRIMRVVRVIKLLRILKIFKMTVLAKHLQQITGSATPRMFGVVGGSFLLLHLMACSYFYAAQLHQEEQVLVLRIQYGDTWQDLTDTQRRDLETRAWEHTWVGYGGLEDHNGIARYITSLYWSIYTLTTVGYGDISPQNIGEKCVAMVGMIFGVSMFAYFMGSMSSLVAAMSSADTIASKKIKQMKEFMHNRRVPRSLSNKIEKFYSVAARHQCLDDHTLLDGLSSPLKTELLLFLYRNTLEKVPFFQGQDPKLITSLVAKLKMEYYAEGDIVTAEGDYGEVMYFVVNGMLEARQYTAAKDNWIADIAAAASKPGSLRSNGTSSTSFSVGTYWKKLRRNTESEIVGVMYPNANDLGEDYELVAQLEPGDYTGEYSCLLQQGRASTVVAVEFAEVYTLTRNDLLDAYREFPELYQEFMGLLDELNAMLEQEGNGGNDDNDSNMVSPAVTANLISEFPQSPSRNAAYQQTSTCIGQVPTTSGWQDGAGGEDGPGSRVLAWGAEPSSGLVGLFSPISTMSDIHEQHQHIRAAPSEISSKFKRKAKQVCNLQKIGKPGAPSSNPVIELLKNGNDMKSMNLMPLRGAKSTKNQVAAAGTQKQ